MDFKRYFFPRLRKAHVLLLHELIVIQYRISSSNYLSETLFSPSIGKDSIVCVFYESPR